MLAVVALADLVLGAVDPATSHDVSDAAVQSALSAGASLDWVVRLLLVSGAALCFLLGPGLVWRARRPESLVGNLALLWVPGALLMAAIGGIAWWLAAWIDPAVVTTLLLVPIPLALLWSTHRWRAAPAPAYEAPVFLVFLLLFAIGVGVSTWSQGPEGELYAGTISRTLEAGPRSDSRISYNVIALLAHGDSPYSRTGHDYYFPYNFYARGPVAGLGAGAVVMSSGGAPARAFPDAPWEPFDTQGFAAYRVTMMLLNATAVLSVAGLGSLFLRRRHVVALAALVALSPFVTYQVYFTWPKLLAGSYALAAAVALVRRRPALAGLLLGVGYLAHPSAMFTAPALVLGWLVLRRRAPVGLVPTGDDAGRSALTAIESPRWLLDWAVDLRGSAWLYPWPAWFLLSRGHTTDYFTGYSTSAYGHEGASAADWVRSRLHLLANTFVPARQFFADRNDFYSNSFFAPSPDVVRFGSLWRANVPFAVGILYLPVFVYGFARFCRRAAWLAVALFAVPVLAFVVYWGANTTGIVQEGVGIFLLALFAAFVGHSVLPHRPWIGWWVRIAVTARVAEVLFLAVVPTASTTGWLGPPVFQATDIGGLVVLGGAALVTSP
ncbi:MAG: hypothetical protein U0W40_07655 [Acidimicrobiia bacterium]